MKFCAAVFTCLSFLTLPVSLVAQGVTTGSVTGTVTGDGAPLLGATVKIISASTGSAYGTISKSKGKYLIKGVRPGTYTLVATFVGLRPDTTRNVMVDVGDATLVNISMQSSASSRNEIVVSAQRDAIFDASRTGSGSVIDEAAISAAPTINRSISDIARMNPYANQTQTAGSDGLQGLSIMGVNSRFNNFQIDGAVANDVFALGAAGTAGSQANSNFLSLDAIERIRVNVSPYDIRQSGFTGGLVNAITRGGTNEYHGSVFFFGRNQDLVGPSPDASKRPFDKFYDYQFGGRVGGPIVKDKLLFHVTAEGRLRSTPIEVALNDPTALNNFPVNSSVLDQIQKISLNTYGYDAGQYGTTNILNNTVNIIARLDYNIDDQNKIQLRHNFTYGIQDRNLQRDNLNYSLTSRMNTFESINNQTVLQWNGVFSPELTNELRASYTQTNDSRILPSDNNGNPIPFPEVRVQVGSGLNVILGPERSSQANALDQTLIALTDDLTWFLGDHTFTVGTHNEFSRFNNLFIQDYYGSYQFATVEDYQAGHANYYRVSYANDSVVGNNPSPRAAWNMMQLGLYAQDEWQVNDALRMTGGLRIDAPIFLTTPYENPAFAQAFPGMSTSEVPSGTLLFSPRVGFNYDVSGDKTWQLRGGTGVFTGRVAGVWLSNQYSNTGMDLFRAELGGNNLPNPITSGGVPVNWDLRVPAPRPGDSGYPGSPINTSAINITDKNFRMPQVWRSTLATDIQLVKGIVFTLEGMYGLFINQVDYTNLNLRRSNLTFIKGADTLVGVSPLDGRPLYAGTNADSLVDRKFTQVILMRTRSEGQQYSISGQLKIDETNKYIPGLTAMIQYTFGRTQDLNSSTAATASSQWSGTDVIDPNNATVGTSNFDFLHRVSVSGSYRITWTKGIWTSFGVFYSGNSGRPYSLSYAQDYNGDNAAGGNDLVYVPRSEDYNTKIVIPAPTDATDLRSPDQIWSQIMSLIDNNPVLKEYQGKILPRNALREPWINQLDLRIQQEFPAFSTHSVQFTLDVQNVLNLLNSSWGQQRYVNFQSANLFGLVLDNNGKPFDSQGRLRMTYTEPITNGQPGIYTTDNFYSRWRMQLGMRYTF
ncbi:MAG: carboxypeptidase regulatory-like domain-containing protein [Candidatus Kapabacteria bacterium]|nr:carboxypeptidase regulatory-like domain-containing protein [Candidatus Kapabacteria bacterium]